MGTSLLQLLDECTRTNLQELRNTFFDWLLISTALVLVGVIFEEADVTFTFKRVRRCLPIRILLPMHRLDRWAKTVSMAGRIVLLIGVIGEGVFEGLVSQADGWLQDFSNIQLAAAQRQASGAFASAESARALVKGYDKQISDARKDAAQANAKAAASDLARARIEKQLAWRTLGETNREAVAKQLRPFALGFFGRKVEVSSYLGDAEGTVFAIEIAD